MSKPQSESEKKADSQSRTETPEVGKPGRRSRDQRRHIEPSVNMDELRELIVLIQENGFAEFEIQREDFRLHVRRDADVTGTTESAAHTSRVAPAEAARPQAERTASGAKPSTPDHPGARAETAASEDQDLYMIPSPIVGTFYRSPSPNADPFVKIGSYVESDSVVCVIEAMKLMNEIQADVAGEVVKIYVENGQPVEYGQPLFGIRK